MDKVSQIALSLIPGLGAVGCRQLMAIYPNEDIFALSPIELKSTFGSHQSIAEAIVHKTTHARAEEELRFCERYHIRPLFFTDDDYPQRLNRDETADSPVVLYVHGSLDLNPERAVAVVGTRRATAQGCDNTERIVGQLQSLGLVVVSGLAYGIDTAAHTAALDHGLPTVAVLGHGLDRIYPAKNRPLAKRILDQGGALVTEYPSGSTIQAGNFPARNRIIAALADATVVIEASEKGGALITATIAAGYHREVFAVPGRLSDPYSRGTNNLIATNRASMLRDADDLVAQMGWPSLTPQSQGKQQSLFPEFTSEEHQIIELLHLHQTMALDTMVSLTGKPMPKLAAVLLNLEMRKAIRLLPGHLYEAVV